MEVWEVEFRPRLVVGCCGGGCVGSVDGGSVGVAIAAAAGGLEEELLLEDTAHYPSVLLHAVGG